MTLNHYDILDKDGITMPRREYNRPRTLREATKMLERLNKNGEFKPYTMIPVEDHSEEWNFPIPPIGEQTERGSILIDNPRSGFRLKINTDWTYSVIRST